MDEELRTELLRRAEKDQVARRALDLDGTREADGEQLTVTCARCGHETTATFRR
jgi:hypothetical protein